MRGIFTHHYCLWCLIPENATKWGQFIYITHEDDSNFFTIRYDDDNFKEFALVLFEQIDKLTT